MNVLKIIVTLFPLIIKVIEEFIDEFDDDGKEVEK